MGADLQRHPLSAAFGDMPPDEFADLVADVKKNGLVNAVVYLRDEHDTEKKMILDGWHRYRACIEAGITPRLEPFDYVIGPAAEQVGDRKMTPAEFVVAANAHRRHLTREQRRQIVVELLKAKPEASDRVIAAQAKVDHKTVGAVRREAEATGEIPQLSKTTGKDGKTRAKPAKLDLRTLTKGERERYKATLEKRQRENAAELAALQASRQSKPAEAAAGDPSSERDPAPRVMLTLDDFTRVAGMLSTCLSLARLKELNAAIAHRIKTIEAFEAERQQAEQQAEHAAQAPQSFAVPMSAELKAELDAIEAKRASRPAPQDGHVRLELGHLEEYRERAEDAAEQFNRYLRMAIREDDYVDIDSNELDDLAADLLQLGEDIELFVQACKLEAA